MRFYLDLIFVLIERFKAVRATNKLGMWFYLDPDCLFESKVFKVVRVT